VFLCVGLIVFFFAEFAHAQAATFLYAGEKNGLRILLDGMPSQQHQQQQNHHQDIMECRYTRQRNG